MWESKSDILLLGAGYTLIRLAQKLGPERVVLTHSSPEKVKESTSKGFLSFLVDLTRPDTISACLEKFTTIRYIVDSVPPIENEPSKGIEHFIRTITEERPLLRKNICGVIYLSSTGVYGRENGEAVHECDIPTPYDERGNARLLCEKAWQELGCKTISLRLSGIYGPNRGLQEALLAGSYRFRRGRWSNRIHVEDIVKVVVKLLETESLKNWPPMLSVSDNEPALIEEVVEFYCEALGISLPNEISPTTPITGFQRSNQKVINKKLRKYLNVDLCYPTYRSTIC
jgi:nucleoside-diphosphate-sugar epimerase